MVSNCSQRRKLVQIYLLPLFSSHVFSTPCFVFFLPHVSVPPMLPVIFWAATPSFSLIAELKAKSCGWSYRKRARAREREKRAFIKPAANWDSTKIMGSDSLMKTCYVLPLPSFLPSFALRHREEEVQWQNKELRRGRKKDRRRIRASTVLLQKKKNMSKDRIDAGSHLRL